MSKFSDCRFVSCSYPDQPLLRIEARIEGDLVEVEVSGSTCGTNMIQIAPGAETTAVAFASSTFKKMKNLGHAPIRIESPVPSVAFSDTLFSEVEISTRINLIGFGGPPVDFE